MRKGGNWKREERMKEMTAGEVKKRDGRKGAERPLIELNRHVKLCKTPLLYQRMCYKTIVLQKKHRLVDNIMLDEHTALENKVLKHPNNPNR